MIDGLTVPLRWRSLSTALEVVLLIAFGVSLAHWTWTIVAPWPVAESPLNDRVGAERRIPAVRRNLFGMAEEGRGPAADVARVSNIRLLGVISLGTAGSGRAILALESGKPKTVEAGAPIAPGYVLKEVHADQVLISRAGNIEWLKLDRRGPVKK